MSDRKTTKTEKAGAVLGMLAILGLPALVGFIIYIDRKVKHAE